MAAWSCLKNFIKLNTTGYAIGSIRNGQKIKAANYVPIRTCHDRTLIIRASTFRYYKIKDIIYFYLTLGFLPLGAIITYVNVFIGPAELAVIPECYEPEHWEYYRHPITRFIARYLIPSRQEVYERNLHHIFQLNEIGEIIRTKKKVTEKMKERLDYQYWYYDAPNLRYPRKTIEEVEEYELKESSVSKMKNY